MRRHTFLLVFLVMVLAVGCGETDPSGSDRTEPSAPATTVTPTTGPRGGDIPEELVDREWKVTHYITIGGPQPVPVQAEARLTFEAGGRVNVDTGCNGGSGTVTQDEGTITISELALTEMGCANENLASLERTIIENFSHPLGWTVTEGQLTLIPTDLSDSGLQLEDAGVSG